MREEPGAWKPVSRRGWWKPRTAGDRWGEEALWRENRAVSWGFASLLLLSGSRGEIPPLWFLKTSAGSQCSLMLFYGWILFDKFKDGLSSVSRLAVGYDKVWSGDTGSGRQQELLTFGLHFNIRGLRWAQIVKSSLGSNRNVFSITLI